MVILKSDHLRVVNKLKRKILVGHIAWGLVVCVLLILPYIFKLEMDLAREDLRVVKVELRAMSERQELLNLIRSKPLTVGQAIDIADVILSQSDIPVSMILGIIAQESGFKPEAISEKGAKGLMQVMPAVFRTYSVHPLLGGGRQIHDPASNVRAGLSYLSDLNKTYGNWREVLRAYVAGPENARNKTYDWFADGVIKKTARYNMLKD